MKRKKKLSSGKRSKFEEAVAEQLQLRGWKYESEKIKYRIPESVHTYTPDFSKERTKTKLEVKGRFHTRAEATKYIHIRDSNPNIRIVFIFQNPKVPMPGAKRRKDGTIDTVSDWSERNSFDWYSIQNLCELE